MKYAIVIPSGGGDRLDVCLDSIDPEIRKNVLIYKNAPGIVERDDVLGYGGTGINDGVSAGWNYGVQYVLDNDLDYVVILSQHTVFTEGARDFIAELQKGPQYGLISQEGWHCIALSNKTLKLVGDFDTNFYPIYYEDTDYELRLYKAGIIDDVDRTEIACLETPGGYSTTLGMRPEVEGCKAYFIRKWGEIFSYVDYEKQTFYEHPFNDQTKPNSYWEHKTTAQLILDQGYDKRPDDLYIKDVRQ